MEIPYSNKEFDFEKAKKVHKILVDNLKEISCRSCKRENSKKGCKNCIDAIIEWQPSEYLLNFMTNHITEIFNNQENEKV